MEVVLLIFKLLKNPIYQGNKLIEEHCLQEVWGTFLSKLWTYLTLTLETFYYKIMETNIYIKIKYMFMLLKVLSKKMDLQIH